MYNDQNTRQETVQIPLGRLHQFPHHPYKVEDNEGMEALTESIREYGILNPLLVRRVDGSETDYELISGHRRAYAAEKAGLNTVPAIIVALDRNEAAIALVDSNLHREHILPSEKAFAYKMKLEAMKRQGRRTDLTSCQVGTKLRTDDQIAETADDSARQIQRYIRLTNLIPDLLDQMDEGRIAFSVGVELSYLDEQSQYDLLNSMERNDCTPSYSQAVRLHRAANAGTLNRWLIETTLEEQKPNQKDQIRLRREDFRRYFPSGYTDEEIKKDILAGLALLHRQRERDRDAR
ncbi:MAG: ParB/RepB/Spo0J family partition protein [Oscillospiraceae bacterium]|nr:ParB/RepB/Spo0J family partition protein [Oscillospiraceae bacterium]